MGLNAVVVVRCDLLHAIEDDAEFGRNLAMAINAGPARRHALRHLLHDAKVIGISHVSDAVLLSVRDADGHFVGPGHESDVELLRRVAGHMGYRLSKKPSRAEAAR